MSQNQLTASYIARNGHDSPKVQEDAKALVIDGLPHAFFVEVGKLGSLWYDQKTQEHVAIFDN